MYREHERDPDRCSTRADAPRRPYWSDTTEALSGWQSDAAGHARVDPARHRVCANRSDKRPGGTTGEPCNEATASLFLRQRSWNSTVVGNVCPEGPYIVGGLFAWTGEGAPVWICSLWPDEWSPSLV